MMGNTLAEWSDLGVQFFITNGIDLSTPEGVLMTHFRSAFAEFERSVTVSCVVAGLNVARARGVKLGRRSNLTPELILKVQNPRAEDKFSRQISWDIGTHLVSKATAERICKGTHVS